jgi:hypothetical protein
MPHDLFGWTGNDIGLQYCHTPTCSEYPGEKKSGLLKNRETMIDRENRRNVYFCIRKSSPSEKFFYLKDHLGNIRVTIDDESNVVGYNDYYPFGLQMPERSMNNANSEDIYKFSGKELDKEYGLDYYYEVYPAE